MAVFPGLPGGQGFSGGFFPCEPESVHSFANVIKKLERIPAGCRIIPGDCGLGCDGHRRRVTRRVAAIRFIKKDFSGNYLSTLLPLEKPRVPACELRQSERPPAGIISFFKRRTLVEVGLAPDPWLVMAAHLGLHQMDPAEVP